MLVSIEGALATEKVKLWFQNSVPYSIKIQILSIDLKVSSNRNDITEIYSRKWNLI